MKKQLIAPVVGLSAFVAACAARQTALTAQHRVCTDEAHRTALCHALEQHFSDVREMVQMLRSAPRDQVMVQVAVDARARIQLLMDLWQNAEKNQGTLRQRRRELDSLYRTLHHYILQGAPPGIRRLPPPIESPGSTTELRSRTKEYARRRV